jgi:site-specific recombinase XerD
VDNRRRIGQKLEWWLVHEEELPATLDALDPDRLRRFFQYYRTANPEGRFGCASPNARVATRPSSLDTIHRNLHAFFRFLRAEGLLDHDPLANIRKPKVPRDVIQPFSAEELQRLLDAARRGRNPERDLCLLLVMIDTGLRAAEVCGLKIRDVDRASGALTVIGKGSKRRIVYVGASARRAMWRYLELLRRGAGTDEPLFAGAGGGRTPGGPLTRSGLFQLYQRLGEAAGISGVRCSPHTVRHSMAIAYLRNGGSVLELQRLLGHESLEMCKRYVAYAQSDLQAAHRQHSPADRLRLR